MLSDGNGVNTVFYEKNESILKLPGKSAGRMNRAWTESPISIVRDQELGDGFIPPV